MSVIKCHPLSGLSANRPSEGVTYASGQIEQSGSVVEGGELRLEPGELLAKGRGLLARFLAAGLDRAVELAAQRLVLELVGERADGSERDRLRLVPSSTDERLNRPGEVGEAQRQRDLPGSTGTGGTAGAATRLVKQLGGDLRALAFLIELDVLKGREKLAGETVYSVLRY